MDFITTNILRNPPVLLGLIAMLGLILQKKSVAEIVKGTLLAAFGMVILNAGVGMLVGSISPINAAFQSLAGTGTAQRCNLYWNLWRRRGPRNVYRPDSSPADRALYAD